METSLHRALKEQYGAGGQLEVAVGGYRADALGPDGVLVEVQSGPLGPLRAKLGHLLADREVRVVKPVVLARRLVRRARRDGSDLSARFSPKRAQLADVFTDLVGFMRVFPHRNLRVEVLGVVIDEVRVARRRWPGHVVVDRVLRAVSSRVVLETADDLWSLLPADLDGPFTTRTLAERLGRPLHQAQRVAYCLRLAGAAAVVEKQGNRRVYLRTGASGAGAGAPAL